MNVEFLELLIYSNINSHSEKARINGNCGRIIFKDLSSDNLRLHVIPCIVYSLPVVSLTRTVILHDLIILYLVFWVKPCCITC